MWFGSEEKVDTNKQAGGRRNGNGGLGHILLFKIQAATSCWEFRMRQGRMEPRGSGASQVGQRPWPSPLEILCWSCLLRFCWWAPERKMLHSSHPLPTSPGTISVQVLHPYRSCCLRQLCEWQRDAEARGLTLTDKTSCGHSLAPSLASTGDTIYSLTSLVATEALLPFLPLVSINFTLPGSLHELADVEATACATWTHEVACGMRGRASCTQPRSGTYARYYGQRGRTRGQTPAEGFHKTGTNAIRGHTAEADDPASSRFSHSLSWRPARCPRSRLIWRPPVPKTK